jgi:hypothetical protein
MHILDSLRCLLDVLIAVEHRASELKDYYIFYQQKHPLEIYLFDWKEGWMILEGFYNRCWLKR